MTVGRKNTREAMTHSEQINEIADAILAQVGAMTPATVDELITRLAMDRAALLDALKDLLDLGRAGFIRGEDIAVTRAVNVAIAAVKRAERPR